MPLVTVPALRESWEVAPGVLDRHRFRETGEMLDILEDLAWAELWAPGLERTTNTEEVLL